MFAISCYIMAVLSLLGGVAMVPVTLGMSLIGGLCSMFFFVGLASLASEVRETKKMTEAIYNLFAAQANAQRPQAPAPGFSQQSSSRLSITTSQK